VILQNNQNNVYITFCRRAQLKIYHDSIYLESSLTY